MSDWYEFLEEELKEKYNMSFEEDEDCDKLQDISQNLEDAIIAEAEFTSYGTPSSPNFGVNNSEKREIDKLKEAIRMLEIASGLTYEDGSVYKYGMRHVGGTISASYKDKLL